MVEERCLGSCLDSLAEEEMEDEEEEEEEAVLSILPSGLVINNSLSSSLPFAPPLLQKVSAELELSDDDDL